MATAEGAGVLERRAVHGLTDRQELLASRQLTRNAAAAEDARGHHHLVEVLHNLVGARRRGVGRRGSPA
eukprot:scaffold1894_cov368-Prasinococcus_capsulatus_cf.AAC.13